MKLAIALLIFSNGLSIFQALNDSCGLQDLNAMMVRLNQLRTEFKNLKTEHARQTDINNNEINLLKDTNEQQAKEIKDIKTDLGNKMIETAEQAQEIKEIKADLGNKTIQTAEQEQEIKDIKADLGNKTIQIAEQTQEIERLNRLSKERNLTRMVSFVARQKEVHYDCVSKVPFENVLLNEGNAFNSTTSLFTAPAAGLYILTAQLCSHTSSSFDFSIYSQTKNKAYGASRNGLTNDHDCRSLTTIARLTTYEAVYVHVECPGVGQIEGHINDKFWTMFSGVFLV